jgi:hypothetical protein
MVLAAFPCCGNGDLVFVERIVEAKNEAALRL